MQNLQLIIGYIDSYGAIHSRKIFKGDHSTHGHYWPTVHSRRWRFDPCEWKVIRSGEAEIALNDEEAEQVLRHVEKLVSPATQAEVMRQNLWGILENRAKNERTTPEALFAKVVAEAHGRRLDTGNKKAAPPFE